MDAQPKRIPTRQECLEAAAEVVLRAAIRIEGERAAAWAELEPSRRAVLVRADHGCWLSDAGEQEGATRLCGEPRCVYPPHLA